MQLTSGKASYIFKLLWNSEHCHASCSADYFRPLDHNSTRQIAQRKQAIKLSFEFPHFHALLDFIVVVFLKFISWFVFENAV